MPGRRASSAAGWRATTCRVSAWRGCGSQTAREGNRRTASARGGQALPVGRGGGWGRGAVIDAKNKRGGRMVCQLWRCAAAERAVILAAAARDNRGRASENRKILKRVQTAIRSASAHRAA